MHSYTQQLHNMRININLDARVRKLGQDRSKSIFGKENLSGLIALLIREGELNFASNPITHPEILPDSQESSVVIDKSKVQKKKVEKIKVLSIKDSYVGDENLEEVKSDKVVEIIPEVKKEGKTSKTLKEIQWENYQRNNNIKY